MLRRGPVAFSLDARNAASTRWPAGVATPLVLRDEDEVARAAVSGIRRLAAISALDEPSVVVADGRGRQARPGGERVRRAAATGDCMKYEPSTLRCP
jgi:hypothetical protein